ncbi:AAA family ATPase [bacterium]|nr:MAG: AAA family ATPase [bacterium]
MSKLEVLAEFGYNKDPFRGYRMETADSLRLKRVLKMAIESRSMISVVASWGFGKTSALDIAFGEIPARVIRLITPDKERVVVSDIEKALILGLSNEQCKRTKEVRARQIRRIIGEASREQPVILVLEEAHRMHGQTLRALKTFREMDWMGQSPLFTVVMVGQYDPMRKRGVDEVRLRTDSVHMRGLAGVEASEYVRHTVGKSFEPDAIEAVSRLNGATNFLDLQDALINLMGRALGMGQKKVTALEVFDLYGGGVKELLKRYNITLSELEKETGISKATLNLVANDKQSTLTGDTFADSRQAVSEVLRKKLAEGGSKNAQGIYQSPVGLTNKKAAI